MSNFRDRVKSALGTVIRQHRKHLHMQQEELAERLDVSQSAVSSWETGVRAPNPETLAKAATLFSTTTANLFREAAEIYPPAALLADIAEQVGADTEGESHDRKGPKVAQGFGGLLAVH